MGDTFDPYRDWLGLKAAHHPVDHYQLLDLPVGESDAKTIAAARDRALAKLRKVEPGERRAEWERLVRQVRGSARCLLDPERRAEYDAERSRPASTAPMARPLSAGEVRAVSAQPKSAARAAARRRSSLLPHLLLTAVLAVAVGVAGTYLWQVLQQQGILTAGRAVPNPGPSSMLPEVVLPNDPPAANDLPLRKSRPAPQNGDSTDRSADFRSADPVASPPNRSEWKLTVRQRSAVRQYFAALHRRDGPAADALIAEAEPPLPPKAVATLKMLRTSVEFYRQGIERGIDAVKSGDTFPYEGGEAIVVARTDEGLQIRTAGRTEIISLEPPPEWLVEEVAERHFDRTDPANWITLGARELVDPAGDLRLVRRLWQRAARAGEPGDQLLPLVELAEPRDGP